MGGPSGGHEGLRELGVSGGGACVGGRGVILWRKAASKQGRLRTFDPLHLAICRKHTHVHKRTHAHYNMAGS